MSKLFEKLIIKRLAGKKNLFQNDQFRFRQNHAKTEPILRLNKNHTDFLTKMVREIAV